MRKSNEIGKARQQAALGALLVFIGFIFSGCSSTSSPPQPAALEEFTVPVPVSWQLPNGLQVMYFEDPELPLVEGVLYMRGGNFWEDSGSPLVASVMGREMRQGGAGEFGPSELDRRLVQLAASVSSSFGNEYGTVSFSALSSDFQEVFGIFSDVVLRPRFAESRLELWKKQSLENIRRRKDDPATIARLSFQQLLFGDHPQGYVSSSDDVHDIRRADILLAHQKFVRPQEAILIVSGNVAEKEVRAAVQEHFSSWAATPTRLADVPISTQKEPPGIYFIEGPFEQATVFVGQRGPKRHSDDQIAIIGFNRIFGQGGLSSRLAKTIRMKRGLAYLVYGTVDPGYPEGRNLIALQTKAQSAGEALEASLEVLDDVRQAGITGEELQREKKALQSSFVFKFRSYFDILERRALQKLLGYSESYDKEYLSKVKALTTEDIHEVARERWNPEELIIVVVGNKTAYNSLREQWSKSESQLAKYTLMEVGFQERLVLEE